MKAYQLWLGGLAALALFSGGPARGQLRIEISKGVEKPVPIAIIPVGWQASTAAPFDVAGLITADLFSSGRFQPLE